jgi:hypothetical protein
MSPDGTSGSPTDVAKTMAPRVHLAALLVGLAVALAASAGSGVATGRADGHVRVSSSPGVGRTTIRLNGVPVAVAVGGGSVFVLVGGTRGERLLRLDRATGAVRSTTGLGSDGSDYGGVAVGAGAVWAAAGSRLFRLSLTGRITATVDVGATALSVFASRSGVWVTRAVGRLGQLVRVDPRSKRVVARTRMGGGPDSVVVALGSVWVANTSLASLMRIDLRTSRVVATLWPTSLRSALALAHGLLWVAGERLLGLDAQGRIVRRAPLPGMVAGVAAQDDHLWAIEACCSAVGRLLRIDLPRGHVSATVKVGRTPVSVAVGYGAVWVANFEDSSLSRIPY